MRTALSLIIGICLAISTAPCLAGVGPQSVVVVVNTNSWASLSVANEYIRQRNIPPSHVVALDLPLALNDDTTDIETFREKILKPILAAINSRGLQNDINCVAYSTDIPTAIDFTADTAKLRDRTASIGSINGLTFLQTMVLEKKPYWSLNANQYFRKPTTLPTTNPKDQTFEIGPSLALDRWASANQDASPKYLLSTVLGVTNNRGNSVAETMAYLRRSASADGTQPAGTFYYMYDWAIRTETRQPWFKSAIAKLQTMGQQAQQINDGSPKDKDHAIAMPVKRPDIIGAMLGQQYPNPQRSGSTFLPGAIVENLTSEGGIMSWAGGQVPISEFIRFGAAGTAGTVTEPMAIWQKFPSPFIFIHYAAGCSLSEAFYQSVNGPFQLLIIGDPLCRPFAKIPTVTVENLTPNQIVSANWPAENGPQVSIKGRPASDFTIRQYVDGLPLVAGKPLAPGNHQYMAAATANDDIAAEGFVVVPFIVNNASMFERINPQTLTLGQSVSLRAHMPGASKIEIWHSGRIIKTIDGEKGDCEIPSMQLGIGPVRLDAVAQVQSAPVTLPPVNFDVVAPRPLPAIAVQPAPGETFLDGPMLTAENIGPVEVLDMRRRPALQEAKVPVGGAYKIEAYFDVPADDLCQFQVWTDGSLALHVDGKPLAQATGKGWTFMPVSLAKGKHQMTVQGTAGPERALEIRFGPPGTRSIGKRCHNWDAEHLSLHFSHLGKTPTTTTSPTTQPQ